MILLPHNTKSFFTGQTRHDGLHLRFYYENHEVVTDVNVNEIYQGFEGVVHGGILFGILDTLIWSAIFMEAGKSTMTRKTEMDFFKPVLCETPYRAHGKLEEIEGRDFRATAWMEDENGEVYCRLNGLFREGKSALDADRLFKNMDFTGVLPEIKEYFLKAGNIK